MKSIYFKKEPWNHHKYPVFLLLQLYDVFLYQKVRGGAMQDILSERHLKISTFRRRKPDVQPFCELDYKYDICHIGDGDLDELFK